MHSLTRSLTLGTLGTLMLCGLAACGSDEKTIVHEKPVVVQPAQTKQIIVPSGGVTPGTVEQMCPNGYNNATRSCF